MDFWRLHFASGQRSQGHSLQTLAFQHLLAMDPRAEGSSWCSTRTPLGWWYRLRQFAEVLVAGTAAITSVGVGV